MVTNGSGGALAVGATTPGTVDGLAIADLSVSIADGVKKAIGPFPRSVYNDSDGDVTVTFDATSSVTAQCLKI